MVKTMKHYFSNNKISREHYNLLLNWRRIIIPLVHRGRIMISKKELQSLPSEIKYMSSPEYYFMLSEWINGADVFEIVDETKSVNNSTKLNNQTTLGDVIAELQEQLRQVGNINVKIYDSDDHMVITYE